jgi:hypothetical protein
MMVFLRNFWLVLTAAAASLASAGEFKLGIIGTDTSHVIAFTDSVNNTNSKTYVPGAKVIAAFKGGSPDVASSASRVEEYASKLRDQYGVKLYDSIEAMCRDVDAVLLESVDGRPHLEQAKPVIAARKQLFIDKPMAGSLRDVIQIFRLAREAKVPVFSSSALRFARDSQAVRNGSIGKVLSAETYGPCETEPHHPELFWYGVHGVEALFTVMGTGCVSAQRSTTPDGMIEVKGVWKGNRSGIFRQSKNKKFYGSAKGEKGEAPVGSIDGYGPLVAEIVKFLQTGVPPIPEKETIEIFAFMEASDVSKANGGKPVKLKEVIKAASK